MEARFEYLGSAKIEDVKALIEERDELVTKIGDLQAILRNKKQLDAYDAKLRGDVRLMIQRLERVINELDEKYFNKL